MKCPECNEEIKRVNVISEVSQLGFLEGNKLVSFGEADVVSKPKEITCGKCGADIRDSVETA